MRTEKRKQGRKGTMRFLFRNMNHVCLRKMLPLYIHAEFSSKEDYSLHTASPEGECKNSINSAWENVGVLVFFYVCNSMNIEKLTTLDELMLPRIV